MKEDTAMPRGIANEKTSPDSPKITTEKTTDTHSVTNNNYGSNGATDTADHYEVKEFSPRDVRGYEGTLWVRNNTATTVSFDNGNSKDHVTLRLEQAGRDGSVSVLPQVVANHPGFQKFWRKGKVTVTDDPEMEIQLEKYSVDEVEVERLQAINTQAQIFNTQQRAIPMPKIGIFADDQKA